MTVQDLIRHQARGGKTPPPPELEALDGEAPGQQSISAGDLAYIQKHPRAVIIATKPRLARLKLNLTLGVPVNTVSPLVTGTGTVGQTLTCSTGTWTGVGITYTYKWRRAGQVIAGATAATYVLVAGDSGKSVDAAVTATNSAGAATEYSNNAIAVA